MPQAVFCQRKYDLKIAEAIRAGVFRLGHLI